MPELLTEHFDLDNHKVKGKDLHRCFEEKTEATKEFSSGIVIGGGFHKEARSIYLLYKAPNGWTQNQYIRSKILFQKYPDIKKAYNLVQGLRNIFNTATSIQAAYTKLAHWYNDVEKSAFNTIANTITLNYRSILNYFINRSINASAEAFRAQFRGLKI